MPHLLEIHFRKFVKHCEKNYERKKQQVNKKKEIKKENITKYDKNDLNFEDFFYENLTIFF